MKAQPGFIWMWLVQPGTMLPACLLALGRLHWQSGSWIWQEGLLQSSQVGVVMVVIELLTL